MNQQSAPRTVRELLFKVGLEKGLRQSTVLSYERLIGRPGILDEVVDAVTQGDVLNKLCAIDNPNSRRATVIALRSVFGWRLRIPKGVPRRYELPDEDTLRLDLDCRVFQRGSERRLIPVRRTRSTHLVSLKPVFFNEQVLWRPLTPVVEPFPSDARGGPDSELSACDHDALRVPDTKGLSSIETHCQAGIGPVGRDGLVPVIVRPAEPVAKHT